MYSNDSKGRLTIFPLPCDLKVIIKLTIYSCHIPNTNHLPLIKLLQLSVNIYQGRSAEWHSLCSRHCKTTGYSEVASVCTGSTSSYPSSGLPSGVLSEAPTERSYKLVSVFTWTKYFQHIHLL